MENRRRSTIAWTRIIRPGEEIDLESADIDDWIRMSPGDRMVEAWRLSEDVWEWVQDKEPSEPGLSRSVVRIHRG